MKYQKIYNIAFELTEDHGEPMDGDVTEDLGKMLTECLDSINGNMSDKVYEEKYENS